jgi:hypothetical protein
VSVRVVEQMSDGGVEGVCLRQQFGRAFVLARIHAQPGQPVEREDRDEVVLVGPGGAQDLLE